MNKSITISHNSTDYKLEFNKATVRQMEKSGFILDEVPNKPVTLIPILFHGAFMVNHERTSSRVIDEIYDSLDERSDLIAALIDMYNETVEAFIDDKNNGEPKNSTWKKSW